MRTQSIEARWRLVNEKGLHARVAAQIARSVGAYECNVFMANIEEEFVPADDVLELLALGALHGQEIVVKAEGSQAQSVMEELEGLFKTGFGELE